jgi:hypothetical protein
VLAALIPADFEQQLYTAEEIWSLCRAGILPATADQTTGSSGRAL